MSQRPAAAADYMLGSATAFHVNIGAWKYST
jgi:hypothetical protein